MPVPCESKMVERTRHHAELSEEVYELPGQPPASLSFLLGQIVARMDMSDEKMDDFKATALAVRDDQAEIKGALATIRSTQEEHSKKLTRVDTAITMAGITSAAGKAVPFLGIGSVIVTALYWLRSHIHWGA